MNRLRLTLAASVDAAGAGGADLSRSEDKSR
ncbi:hypothetical protein QF049_004758 [Paenibacillus sp. W4I10]|nr:hypothetical protein [Paenibacillus sp. W4I10]